MIADITILFNNMYNNGYFPAQWKTTIMCPILKKGKDPKGVASYRPVSLLPNLSKVFERTLVEKLQQHDPAKLPDEQFSFTNGLSTVHAVNTIITRCGDLTNNKVIGTLLIDLQKAFDSVSLEGLPDRMSKNKCPGQNVQN